ncbi:hypothetical protein AGMMS50267_13700 [Spirochaetia bacterium]|nr:hypothetical protein AGMMS50267_13700 [Spirochaetia bacterium]
MTHSEDRTRRSVRNKHKEAYNTDWLPGTREGQLAMAKDWKGVIPANASAWNIPAGVLQELDPLIQTAETALETEKNESTRTPVATAQCKEAFNALTFFLRNCKRRYFFTPPLQDSDYVSLALKPHDSTPTPSGTPTAQATIETYLVGRHELGLKIIYVTGNPADAANKGYRIWYTVVAQGETPPAGPDDLRKSFFTKKKKDVIEFDFGDSGKTAWFAVQIENEGKKGPWGPLVSELIP